MSTGEKVALGLLLVFLFSTVAGILLGPMIGFNKLPKEGDDDASF
jgi:hypothetical protein